MALEIHYPDSEFWTARIRVNGKLRRFPLTEEDRAGKERRIPIKGKRPSSLKRLEEADNVFLKSHARALAAHSKLEKDLKSAEVVVDQTRRILRANGIEAPLSEMVQRFRDRRKNRSQNYVNQTCGYLARFVDWMKDNQPDVESLLFVRPKHIEDFLETESKPDEGGKRVSAKTWNGIRGTLKTAFTEQARGSTGHKAFDDIPSMPTATAISTGVWAIPRLETAGWNVNGPLAWRSTVSPATPDLWTRKTGISMCRKMPQFSRPAFSPCRWNRCSSGRSGSSLGSNQGSHPSPT